VNQAARQPVFEPAAVVRAHPFSQSVDNKMFLQQKPIAGYWYTNIVGQLVQVRALLYSDGSLSRVALEYANGKRDFVDLKNWYHLDLALHSPRVERRERARDL